VRYSLVAAQVIATNPAAPVRGPKHIVRKGKMPVLTQEEGRALLDSIDAATSSVYVIGPSSRQ
jgi:hypothetical protein